MNKKKSYTVYSVEPSFVLLSVLHSLIGRIVCNGVVKGCLESLIDKRLFFVGIVPTFLIGVSLI